MDHSSLADSYMDYFQPLEEDGCTLRKKVMVKNSGPWSEHPDDWVGILAVLLTP